jgi:hypothetical protein
MHSTSMSRSIWDLLKDAAENSKKIRKIVVRMSNKKDNSKIQEISQQNIISNLFSDHLQTKIATLLFESNLHGIEIK